jgi:hypothetical protein
MGSLEVGGKSAGKKRWRKTLSRWTGRGEMERPAPAGVGQIRTES